MEPNGLNSVIEVLLLLLLYLLNSKVGWVKNHLHQWQVSKYSFVIMGVFSIISVIWLVGQQSLGESFLTIVVFFATVSGFIVSARFYVLAKLDFAQWQKEGYPPVSHPHRI